MEKELDFTDKAALKFLSGLIKHTYDYFKHMTTLNTGSLLIIIALLEGVFKEQEGIFAVVISICCFTISLVCALVTLGLFVNCEASMLGMYSNLLEEKEKEEKEEKTKDYTGKHKKELDSLTKKAKVIEPITIYTFIAGMVMFLVFAFLNFID